MTAVVVNGVDLELLRKHVKEGYNASSATVLALIQIALAEPALREELRIERATLWLLAGEIALISAARVTKGPEAAMVALDELIEKHFGVAPQGDQERVR